MVSDCIGFTNPIDDRLSVNKTERIIHSLETMNPLLPILARRRRVGGKPLEIGEYSHVMPQ